MSKEVFKIVVDKEGALDYAIYYANSSIVRILEEYIKNEMAAGATEIRVTISQNKIKVSGNGFGMTKSIIKNRLLHVFTSKCNLNAGESGKFSIGAQCGLNCSAKVTWYTKTQNDPEYCVVWDTKEGGMIFEGETSKIKGHGTVVTLEGVHSNINEKDLKTFVKRLSTEVSYFQKGGKLYIKTQGIGKTNYDQYIVPMTFSGEGVVCDTMSYVTPENNIEIRINGRTDFLKVIKARKELPALLKGGNIRIRCQVTEKRQDSNGIYFFVSDNRLYEGATFFEFLDKPANTLTSPGGFNPLIKLVIIAEAPILKLMLSENKVVLTRVGELDGVKFASVYRELQEWLWEIIKGFNEAWAKWSNERDDLYGFINPKLIQDVEATLAIAQKRFERGEGQNKCASKTPQFTAWKCHSCGATWRVPVGLEPNFCGEYAVSGDESDYCLSEAIARYTFTRKQVIDYLQQGKGKYVIKFVEEQHEDGSPAVVIGENVIFYAKHPRVAECLESGDKTAREAAIRSYLIGESVHAIAKDISEKSGEDFQEVRNRYLLQRPKCVKGEKILNKQLSQYLKKQEEVSV